MVEARANEVSAPGGCRAFVRASARVRGPGLASRALAEDSEWRGTVLPRTPVCVCLARNTIQQQK